MKKTIHQSALIMVVMSSINLFAQGSENIYLFQNFFQDAIETNVTYIEPLAQYNDFNGFDRFDFGVRGATPVTEKIEIGAALGLLSGEGNTSFSDILLTGRYYLTPHGETAISAGGFFTLPTGSENLGQGLVNIAVFGALRHPASNKTSITGTASLNFLALNKDARTSLGLAAGAIHRIKENLGLLAELTLQTRTYSGSFGGSGGLISGGVDYELSSGGRLRGMLGFGIDDGAPDFKLHAGYMHFF